MLKRYSCLLTVILGLVVFLSCDKTGIPDSIGDWSVEVGPPGNEFYQPVNSFSKAKPPSEDVMNRVRELAPNYTEIKGWELLENNLYLIRSEAETEEYYYIMSADGNVYAIWYENDSTRVEEIADELIIKGTKKSVSLDRIPSKTLKTISTIFPDSPPEQTWIATSLAGTRYIIVLEESVFYARPDGQIQAAGLIKNGALNEIEATASNSDRSENEILTEAREELGKYTEKFNFDNQLIRLGKKPNSSDGSFRFVVMGDSRSNPDLWPKIVKHINKLQPEPDFIINTGDIVSVGYTKEYMNYFIPPLLEVDIPLFIAIGNHDYGSNRQAIEFRYLFGENALNYFFDYGKIRFIMFDNVTRLHTPKEAGDWLNEVLLNTPEDFQIVVAAHKPLGNIKKWAWHAMDIANSKVFSELMSKHQVDHVFFGHIHAYSTATLNNVKYTITGGGGAELANRFGPEGNVHHYVICDVLPDGTIKQQIIRFDKHE